MTADLTTYELFVDGQWQPSKTGRTSERTSPSDGRVIGRYARGDSIDVDLAVAAARRAFDDGPWPTLAAPKRAAVMRKAADLLRDGQTGHDDQKDENFCGERQRARNRVTPGPTTTNLSHGSSIHLRCSAHTNPDVPAQGTYLS